MNSVNKKIIYFLISATHSLACPASAQQPLSVNYTIDFKPLVSEAKSCVFVDAEFTTNKNRELTLNFPKEGISHLSLNKNDFKGEDLGPFTRKFTFPTHGKVTFSYQLCHPNPMNYIDSPILKKDFIHLVANHTLIAPFGTEDELWNVNVQIKEIPDNYFLMTSMSEAGSAHKISGVLSLSELSGFVLVATKQEPVRLEVAGKTVFLNSYNSSLHADKKFTDNLTNIVQYQESLIESPKHLPSMVNIVSADRVQHVFGRHFLNDLSLWWPNEREKEIALAVLSHENFHSWLGWEIPVFQSEMTWFVEGINDYLALNTAYASGALTDEDLVGYVNKSLQNYHLNQLSNLDQKELDNLAANHMEAKALIGLKGHLVALSVFGYSSDCKANPFIKVVKKLIKEPNADYSSHNIKNIIKQNMSSAQFRQLFDLLNKKNVSIDGVELFPDKYKLEEVPFNSAEFGFNYLNYVKFSMISDIDERSPAYSCGLRNGMKVVGAKLDKSGVGLCYVNVKNSKNDIEQYSFKPKSTVVKIWQFKKIT